MVKYQWEFRKRLRARAFSWRSSALACQRIKEAVSEIKKVSRSDLPVGAEGAVIFFEKLVPAIEEVDSSSGALGSATNKAMSDLLPLIAKAQVDDKTHKKWIDRLWTAFMDDGYGYLDDLGDHWGMICKSKETASMWADRLMKPTTLNLTSSGNYFKGTAACLSCLLVAERFGELMDLLDSDVHQSWYYRKFGVQAFLALGKKSEALKYAENSKGLNEPESAIAQACEDILISSGMYDEAYKRYAFKANQKNSYLATYRSIAKKYPHLKPEIILSDLIRYSVGAEGKWFATAKDLGFLDLAADLAMIGPCDPLTLKRAAVDKAESAPSFSLKVTKAALYWMVRGQFYEITSLDIVSTLNLAWKISASLSSTEELLAWLLDQVEKNPNGERFVLQELEEFIKMQQNQMG